MMKKKIILASDGVEIDLPLIVESLKSICSFFEFDLYKGDVQIKDDIISPKTYDTLNLNVDDDTNFFMIFTDKRYHNNFFIEPKGRAFITSFSDWKCLTKLPKNNGAVYFIADVLSLRIDSTFRHTLNDESKPECIYDFLVDKTGIDSSMRASFICAECNKRIRDKIKHKDDKMAFDDIKIILNELGNASKWDEDIVSYWKKKYLSNGVNREKKRMNQKKNRMFISYSHVDLKWLERVKVHLKPLERNSIIEIWEDTRIQTGDNWQEKIGLALSESQSAILLVSADFLASDFIIRNELPQLLERAEEEGTRIFPIIISPCCFNETQNLSQFQAVNSETNTLIEMNRGEQERVFLRLARSIISVSEGAA